LKYKLIILDFDGRIGRISDPELAPGQIMAVDDLIYNEEITEDQLLNDDGLFSEDKEAPKEAPKGEVKKTVEVEDELADVDVDVSNADFLDNLDNPNNSKSLEEQPKGLGDEEVAVSGNVKDNIDEFLGLSE